MTPATRDAILVGLVAGGLAAYTLLGAAGFWEPVPLIPLALY